MNLSPEQQEVLDCIESGGNVMQLGPAGTGKTCVLQQIQRGYGVHFTAMTGIAACLIDRCTTLHGWAGIGLATKSAEQHAEEIKKKPAKWAKWCHTTRLVIDEISMLSATLFDKLEHIARLVRDSDEPFGGIQLIFSGDFGQLPPVKDSTRVMDAKSWASCNFTIVKLKTSFRQTHQQFLRILQEVRCGKVSKETVEALYDISMERDPTRLQDSDIKPTLLYARRVNVDQKNTEFLDRLQGNPEEYVADDRGAIPDTCTVPVVIRLKLEAQVMLLKNKDIMGGLVNGSRGVVTGWETLQDSTTGEMRAYPVVKFMNGTEMTIVPEAFDFTSGKHGASRTQLPLALAWASTIHKSQGQTIDKVQVDCRGIFEDGQFYVALSRARRLEDIALVNFELSCIRTNKKSVELTDQVESTTESKSSDKKSKSSVPNNKPKSESKSMPRSEPKSTPSKRSKKGEDAISLSDLDQFKLTSPYRLLVSDHGLVDPSSTSSSSTSSASKELDEYKFTSPTLSKKRKFV